MKIKNVKIFLIFIFVTNCGIEGNLVNFWTKNNTREYPSVQPNIIKGLSPLIGEGGTAIAISPSGEPLLGIKSDVKGNNGIFELSFPGKSDFSNVIISVEKFATQLLGIIPDVKKQTSVFNPAKSIFLGELHPAMSEINNKTTSIVLLLIGKCISEGRSFQSISVSSLKETITKIDKLIEEKNEKVLSFLNLVNQIVEDSKKISIKLNPFILKLEEDADVSELLNEKFIKKSGTNVTKEAFRKKILDAVLEFEFKVCYAPDKIRVVFMVDFRDGNKDGNCSVIDKFKWATDKPGKKMYFTGAVHKDTPLCAGERKEYCLTIKQIDEINNFLGNWKPNVIEMFDDGTNGDGVKDDFIWTISFEMPYIPTKLSPDGRGVRIGYKYTWGMPSQGWTGSEEWPGNQRLLEIEDENADHIVLRYDYFGDETTNKDKANLLTPANNGCGINIWEAEKKKEPPVLQKCATDTRENIIDIDGDCKKDSFPKLGTASPITVECK